MAKNTEASLILRIKEVGAATLDKIEASLGAIKEVAMASFAAISAAIAFSIKEYKEQELAINQLNTSLVNQGIYTRQLSQEYQGLADALSKKTKFDDDEIVAAQAAMQNYLGQTKITKELMQATLDLAAAKGIDLKSAAELVAKSIGTSTNALARQGVKLNENATASEKLSAVTRQLNGHFGGQAEAAFKSAGALEQTEKIIKNMAQSLGGEVSPVLDIVIGYFNELLGSMNKNGSLIGIISDGFRMFAKVAIVSMAEIKIFGDGIGAMLATVGAAISQVTQGNMQQALQIIKDGNAQAEADAVATRERTAMRLNEIDDQRLVTQQENMIKEQDLIRANNEQKMLMMEEQSIIDDEFMAVKSEEDIAKMQLALDLKNDLELQAQIRNLNNTIKHETDKSKVIQAENEKRKLMDKAMLDAKMENMTFLEKLETMSQSRRFQQAEQSMSQMARMQDSKHKELVAIGKAAAIAGIITDTAKGVMGVQAWANAIPFVGPALAMGLSAAIIAYGAEQIGRVTSAGMAEGGIVTARPGGMQATIGEGGMDEAVIPLDDERAMGALGGSNITFIVNGGILGNESEAREFAIAFDRELLKLRQSNQSQALTGIV